MSVYARETWVAKQTRVSAARLNNIESFLSSLGGVIIPAAAFNVANNWKQAIDSAIAAALALGGGTVYLPAGSLSISGQITLVDRVSIVGAGHEATRLVFTHATQHGFTSNNGNWFGARMADLTITHATSSTGAALDLCISHGMVDNVETSGFAYGLDSHGPGGAVSARYRSCRFGGNLFGLNLRSGSADDHFVSCEFFCPTTAVGTRAAAIESQGHSFLDCHWYGGEHGIYSYPAVSCRIEGGGIENVAKHNVWLEIPSYYGDVGLYWQFVGCAFGKSSQSSPGTYAAVRLDGFDADQRIGHVLFDGCMWGDPGTVDLGDSGYCIDMEYAAHILISDSIFAGYSTAKPVNFGTGVDPATVRVQGCNVGNGAPIGVPSFANGWVDLGGIYETANYYLDGDGVVHLEGFIKDGTINLKAFTLPVGFRPAKTLHFPAVSNGAFGSLVIEADGDVIPEAGSNSSFSLAAASFRAEA